MWKKWACMSCRLHQRPQQNLTQRASSRVPRSNILHGKRSGLRVGLAEASSYGRGVLLAMRVGFAIIRVCQILCWDAYMSPPCFQLPYVQERAMTKGLFLTTLSVSLPRMSLNKAETQSGCLQTCAMLPPFLPLTWKEKVVPTRSSAQVGLHDSLDLQPMHSKIACMLSLKGPLLMVCHYQR